MLLKKRYREQERGWREILHGKEIVLDFETTGLNLYDGDEFFTWVLTDLKGNSLIRRIDHADQAQNIRNLEELQDFITSDVVIIAQNAKFELTALKTFNKWGFTFQVSDSIHWEDTMVLSQCLQNLCPSHSLDFLAKMFFKYPTDQDAEISYHSKLGAKKWNKENPDKKPRKVAYDMVPKHLMDRYQVADGERTALLYMRFVPQLKSYPGAWEDYRNEIRLIQTIQRMEEYGIMVHENNSRELLGWLESKTKQALCELNEVFDEYGCHGINPRSADQLRPFLKDKLGAQLESFTDAGEESTDKEEIIKLKESTGLPFYDSLLRFRAYDKGSTTVQKYLTLMNDQKIIHPNIQGNKAKTGRQACSSPNLQNVTKETGAGLAYGFPARKCFRARPNNVLYAVDYSGIELRLIIDASGEEELITVMNAGGDVHGCFAEELYLDIFRKESDKARKKLMRGGAKTYDFGKAYGGQFDAVTKDLVFLDHSQRVQGDLRCQKRFPKVCFFSQSQISTVKQYGYIVTPFGRRLYVQKSKAYSGANYLIQSTAGGILKRAQNRIDQYSMDVWDNEIRMNISIHDELFINAPRRLLKYEKKYLSEISELMTHFKEIKVPLEVEWKRSFLDWASAKPMDDFNNYLKGMRA